MKVNVVFFAVLEEQVSDEPLLFEIKNGSTASDLINILSEKFPKVAEILKVTRLAHKDEYVDKNTVLSDGEEYFLIPPVSGG